MNTDTSLFEEYKGQIDQLGKITELGWEIRLDVDLMDHSSLWMKDETGKTLTICYPESSGLFSVVDMEALVRIIFERTFEDWEALWIHEKPMEVYKSWNKARKRLPCKKRGLVNPCAYYLHSNRCDPVYHI